jgi:6-phosphofructo-2-kinase
MMYVYIYFQTVDSLPFDSRCNREHANSLFFENIILFSQILEENIRKVKLSTPDYKDMDPQQAIQDFRQRRENYQRVYEPVDDVLDGRVPHVKIMNSRQFVGKGQA